MGNKGASSGKASGGGAKYRTSSGKPIQVVNLNRDSVKNSKTAQRYMEESNTIMYHTNTGIIEFYKQEGLIGVAKNIDKMNMRNVAKNYKKQYIEV